MHWYHPSAEECFCCNELDDRIKNDREEICLSQTNTFPTVCLDEDVLKTAYTMLIHVRGYRDRRRVGVFDNRYVLERSQQGGLATALHSGISINVHYSERKLYY